MGGWGTEARAPGHVGLERARDLPPAWTDDVGRGARAGLPPARPCATQPPLARQRRARALDAAGPAAWVAGERGDGEHRQRRAWWEERAQAEGLPVSGQATGGRAGRPWQGPRLLARVEEEGGGRWKAGDGTTGARWCAWRWRPWAAPWQPHGRRGLLVRRRLSDPPERPASSVCAPETTVLAPVVQGGAAAGPAHRAVRRPPGKAGWIRRQSGLGRAGLGTAPGRRGRLRSGPGSGPHPCPPHPR